MTSHVVLQHNRVAMRKKRYSSELVQYAQLANMLPANAPPPPVDESAATEVLPIAQAFHERCVSVLPASPGVVARFLAGDPIAFAHYEGAPVQSLRVGSSDGRMQVIAVDPEGGRAADGTPLPVYHLRPTGSAVALQVNGEEVPISGALPLYRLAYYARSTLQMIADLPMQAKLSRGSVSIVTAPRLIRWADAEPISFERDLHYDGFLAALTRTEAALIRRCPVCQRIFVANRIDKGACSFSKSCLQTNRQRKWRDDYKRARIAREEEQERNGKSTSTPSANAPERISEEK